MKLAHWHRSHGDDVVLSRSALRGFFEPEYDLVYGSTIFTRSQPIIARFRSEFPGAIVGGTGLAGQDGWLRTVEDVIGEPSYEFSDYSIYPGEQRSFGMTQRGCRYACRPCVVPGKEGAVVSLNSLGRIWRGAPYPKNIVLLDNDFFGQKYHIWAALLEEARTENYRIAFSQGINVRALSRDIAQQIASVRYYDNEFKRPRLYTAFDNIGDERVFFRGISYLFDAGIKPDHIMAYMLIGYDQEETWERIFYRFNLMIDAGIRVFPMPYQPVGPNADPANKLDFQRLKQFQRWSNIGAYKFAPFAEYDASTKGSMKERRRYRDIALSLFEPNRF